ncbi:MAG: hypothetical protein JSR49_15605 [Proteobacteria bacterium]|nr:hypothetical protein [Pseudomonadota bacterium]
MIMLGNVEIKRVAVIHGRVYDMPAFVTRTACGWQVRVSRTAPSVHMADSDYGGSVQSLHAAAQYAMSMQPDR